MGQGITLGKAIQVFQGELGCTGLDGRENIIDAIQASLEFLLLSGGGELLREWIVTVRNGRFTLPLDLETPVKYKLAKNASCGYGVFHSEFYPYSSQSVECCNSYSDWGRLNVHIRANRTPVQFQPPPTGIRLVATTRDNRDIGKKLSVNGNRCQMQNLPVYFGMKVGGDILTIYAEDDPNKRYGSWIFDEITGVVKELTCSYVMLSGIDDQTGQWYFLSHYTPDEEVPQYTECEIHSCDCCEGCDYKLHILGRTQTGIRYIRDEDILPISSIEILRLLAKRARYDEGGKMQEVSAMETRIIGTIKKQVAYQNSANRNLSFDFRASGASVPNL